jgi:DNA recombination protein RmuC
MSSNNLTIAVIILGFAVLAYLVRKWLVELAEKQRPSDELTEWLKTTHKRMDEQGKSFNQRLDKAAHYIAKVQRNIGEMSEIGRGMKELQEFLQSPKLRGNIGEQVLKDLLAQMLPKQQYKLQHSFSSGVIVDAAITTSSGIIPIDSKFPMENYRKYASADSKKTRERAKRDFVNDVRKHIRDISKKYILPQEGTVDYALMYLTSEAIYYEVVNDVDLFEYATSRRVYAFAPSTFYAFLNAILISFEGQKIETRAKEILSSLRAIEKDYEKVGNDLSTLQRHLVNATNMLTNVLGSFSHLGQRISSAKQLPPPS